MSKPNPPLVERQAEEANLKSGLAKLLDFMENRNPNEQTPPFTTVEFVALYTNVYNLYTSWRDIMGDHLHHLYKGTLDCYIRTKVLPFLEDKHGEALLREFVGRWSDYLLLVRSLTRIFSHLDFEFLPATCNPSLNDTAIFMFRSLVTVRALGEVQATILSLINRERDGAQIDQELVKCVVATVLYIGLPSGEVYWYGLEPLLLKRTATYYSLKASNWLDELSYSAYMSKVNAVLTAEANIAAYYFHPSTMPKLLQMVQQVLLEAYESKLSQMMQHVDLNTKNIS